MNVKKTISYYPVIPLALFALLLSPGCAKDKKLGQAKPGRPAPEQIDLFSYRQGNYNTYRIPALLTTQKGVVLAFTEGRKNHADDQGHIEILLRRSFDGGKTWGPVQVVAKDGTNALNNPTAVQDRDTGIIWLMFVRTSTTKYKDNDAVAKATDRISDVWVMHSDDDGATWSGPADITKSVNRRGWTRVLPGPGVGIQMRTGRLLIPSLHVTGAIGANYMIFSDDHGKTWRIGGSTDEKGDECQVVELQDGSLLLNIRYLRTEGHRGIATSKDGGLTWSKITTDPALIEPSCMGSIIRYTATPQFAKDRLLFSNPASKVDRINLTVRLSYDEGKTWPVAKLLNTGFSGYSCLTVLPNGELGVLYERGVRCTMEKITFARFSLPWLTDGADALERPGNK